MHEWEAYALAGRPSPKDILRFLKKVQVQGEHWIWKAYKTKPGYGRFWYNGRMIHAHRFSYLAFRGEVPELMTVHHERKCLNRACVNPDHLSLLTNEANAREPHEREPGIEPEDDGIPF